MNYTIVCCFACQAGDHSNHLAFIAADEHNSVQCNCTGECAENISEQNQRILAVKQQADIERATQLLEANGYTVQPTVKTCGNLTDIDQKVSSTFQSIRGH